MSAIFKKEFSSYFRNARGYVFLALGTVAIAVLTLFYNFYYGSTRIELVLTAMTLVFGLTAPIITAKSFAKERAAKTELLLFSLPISSAEIVFGKFLAALCLVGVECSLLLLLPVILSIFGTVSYLSAYASVFGFILFAAMMLSIFIFISCTSKKPLIATLISYAVSLGIFLIGFVPTVRTPSVLYTLTTVADKLSLFEILDNLANGLFDINALLYCISLTAIFVFMSIRTLENRRLAGGDRV